MEPIDIDYWIRHFERNSLNRPEPDWSAPMNLRGPSLARLVRSLEQFQLGDGGGPAYLIAWNKDRMLADTKGMKLLVDLWFKEEAEHSRLLGSALKRFGGQEIHSHWSFALFCGVRKAMGVQFELHALLLTEIVSHVYYKMLRKYGKDAALCSMCNLINRDEAGHIAFHRARLAREGLIYSRSYGKMWEIWFKLRGLAAGAVLWMNHRGALIALGGTDREFHQSIRLGMNQFIRGLREDLTRLRAGGNIKSCEEMVRECA